MLPIHLLQYAQLQCNLLTPLLGVSTNSTSSINGSNMFQSAPIAKSKQRRQTMDIMRALSLRKILGLWFLKCMNKRCTLHALAHSIPNTREEAQH